MKEHVLYLFQQYPNAAILLSLCISIIVAVLGVLPSVFVTAANLLFFGFWQGTLISFLGETIGAAVAYVLYRYGFQKTSQKGLERFPKVARLLQAQGWEAFTLILALRLLPFVPSGLVTFAAAVGTVSPAVFLTASSLGKMPALLLEAYTVYEVVQAGWVGPALLVIASVLLLMQLLKKKRQKKEL